jgi:hypothetical protein
LKAISNIGKVFNEAIKIRIGFRLKRPKKEYLFITDADRYQLLRVRIATMILILMQKDRFGL